MELINSSKAVVDSICDMIAQTNDTSRLIALLFLINDILFNSVKVTNAWTYKKDFEKRLPGVMDELYSKGNRDLTKQTKRLVRLWQEKSVFESRFIVGLEATLSLNRRHSYAFNLPSGPSLGLTD